MPSPELYNTTSKPIPPTRISHIDFSDLKQLQAINIQEAFVKCELVLYRIKQKTDLTLDEKLLLQLIIDEIRSLSQV